MGQTLTELQSLVALMRPRLVGGRLQEIRQVDGDRLWLTFRGHEVEDYAGGERPCPGPGRSWCLLISTHPRRLGFHLTFAPPPARLPRPLAFDARLRSVVSNARLESILLPWPDRVIVMDFAHGRSSDVGSRFKLVCELSGHHANIFLLDAEGSILASLAPSASRRRDLGPGRTYAPPPPPDGRGRGTRSALSEAPAAAEAVPARGAALLRAVDERQSADYARQRFESERAALSRAVRNDLARVRRLLARLGEDEARAREAPLWRRRGEALKTVLHEVHRGVTAVAAPDYTSHPPATIEIPLDARLGPQENLAAIFERYRKCERAATHVADRVVVARARCLALEELSAAIGDLPAEAESEAPLAVLADLKERAGALDVRRSRRGVAGVTPAKREGRRLPYHLYRAGDGTELLVGRGGADNASLTFRVGRDNDIWLHVRDRAGAHVIVRKTKGRPTPREVLLDAALLAMHFSKAREDSTAEVHVTPKRLVRSIKGAPPGTVRVERSETLTVGRDPARLARLLASREA